MTVMQATFGQDNLLTTIAKEHQNDNLILLEPVDEKSDFQLITFNENSIFSDPFKYDVIKQFGNKLDGFFSFMYFDLDKELLNIFLAAYQNLFEQSVNANGLNKLLLLKYQIKNDIQYTILSAWVNKNAYQKWYDNIYYPLFKHFIETTAEIESYHEALYHNIDPNKQE